MSDREALRSMLIYAQREAELLKLTSVAQLLSIAVAEADADRPETGRPRGERSIRAEVAAEVDFQRDFGTRRLQ